MIDIAVLDADNICLRIDSAPHIVECWNSIDKEWAA